MAAVPACGRGSGDQGRSRLRDRLVETAGRHRIPPMGITDGLIAPRPLWPHPSVARLSGRIRRAWQDQGIVLHAHHLRRLLTRSLTDDHPGHTQRALDRDASAPRLVQPPARGPVQEVPEGGGWPPHDERRAACARRTAGGSFQQHPWDERVREAQRCRHCNAPWSSCC
jgi:hypothetical protein